jgi:hypothetical protein
MSDTEGQQPGWSYQDDSATDQPDEFDQDTPAHNDSPVQWTASEFIAHHKDASWYLTLAAAVLVASGLIFMFTKDLISVVTTLIVGLLFGVIANKKPRQLTYMIDVRGITVGEKLYPYALFKSFAVHQEGMVSSINLMPLRRFMPDLTIYYPPENEAEVLTTLADYLPHDQRKEQSVDRLMKRFRF